MQFLKLTAIGLCAALAACSALESDKVNYKSAATTKAPTLIVPPDLTQLARDNRYATPGNGPVSAAASGPAARAGAAPASTTATSALADIRIERDGNQRWLVINRPAEQLWEPLKEFWTENGFNLNIDQANLGIMETEWAENRAKLPQDFIRKALGKVLDGLYSTGERDKFRTRLERTTTGTEVFITHRGMIEVYEGNRSERTVWQPRPVDPELETEFLRRLMVKLGAPAEQAKAAQATVVKAATLQLGTQNGQPVLTLEDSFERAWRRVGLSLDRTGFTVEDRDRAQGLYFVRYVAPVMDKTEPGFFSKLFSSKPKDRGPQKYRIVVKAAAGKTTLNVLGGDGNAELTEDAQRILQVLADDLK